MVDFRIRGVAEAPRGTIRLGFARGLLVGAATLAVMLPITPAEIGSFLLAFATLSLGTFLFSAIGFLGGVWVETYDRSKAMLSVTNATLWMVAVRVVVSGYRLKS